jgi:hypothetical protein
LTTGIVAGTSIWKVRGEFAGPVHTQNSFLAALMASLIAQCTEDARSSGGSPEAAEIQQPRVLFVSSSFSTLNSQEVDTLRE